MSNLKLTPWFSGDEKPVRVGVYQRNYAHPNKKTGTVFNYWNGICWGIYGTTVNEAIKYGYINSDFKKLPWRGVLKNE